jgi:polysaccharide biosynthesis/export protein
MIFNSVFLKNILIFLCLLLTVLSPACALKSYIGLGDAAPVEAQLPESADDSVKASVPDTSGSETAPATVITGQPEDIAATSIGTESKKAPESETAPDKSNTSPEGNAAVSGSDAAHPAPEQSPEQSDVTPQTAPQQSAVPEETAEAPVSESRTMSDEKSEYKIGSGDILEIVTWKEPDFTKELPVRIDGKITFTLLDDIQAAGLTTLELKKKIEAGLKLYISDPIVTVAVKGAESQKFYILGEVSKTGEYPLLKNLTVLQAFALAGGFTEWASKKEIILVRYEDGKETVMRINYKNIAKGKDFTQNILIKANDTLIVP